METKANYLMIGGFVLGVLALAFVFVFWMTQPRRRRQALLHRLRWLGGGAHHRSSVGFNGIKVGEVQSLSLDPSRRAQGPGADQRPRRHAGAARIRAPACSLLV